VYFVRSVVVDFAGAICSLFVVSHVCRVLRYGCTSVLVMFVSVCGEVMAVSSAYEAMLMFGRGVVMSCM
jgi:hypothetical protein